MNISEGKQVEDSLYEVILIYRKYLEIAIGHLNEKTRREPDFHPQHRTGYLDLAQKVYYEFHGYGIFVRTDTFEIDFDFDIDRCDFFNHWRILGFLANNVELNAQYPEINFKAELDKKMDSLSAKGLICPIQLVVYENVYVLLDDFGNPQPLKWEIYQLRS